MAETGVVSIPKYFCFFAIDVAQAPQLKRRMLQCSIAMQRYIQIQAVWETGHERLGG